MRYSNQPPSKGRPTGLTRTAAEVQRDNSVVGFGQYKNKTWNDVAEINPSYIVWAHENVTNRTLCSMPLANWCGYVEKNLEPQTPIAPAKNFDDYDDDIPF